MIEIFETAKHEAWERIVKEIQLENNDAKTWRNMKYIRQGGNQAHVDTATS